MSRPIRIGVYADVDANLIDGSSIWLQSLVEVLHQGQRTHIKLILKRPEKRDVITRSLRALDRVELIDPVELRGESASLKPSSVAHLLQQLDRQESFDAILVRGREVANQLSRIEAFAGRLWVYYLPPSVGRLGTTDVAELRQLANSCRYILCQTEQIRVLLEGAVPELSAKLILLPPMVPEIEKRPEKRHTGRGRRFVYVGKFSASYRFLEMVQLFEELRAELPELELHVAGDKIHNPSESPEFEQAVMSALEETPGLVWHGGISRQEVPDLLLQSDIALSLRDAELDRSIELSTKVLEYGATGVPVLLNRTPLYEELLGVDYPMFVDGVDQAHGILRTALLDGDLRRRASEICRTASEAFTLSQTWQCLQPFVEGIAPESRCLWVPERPTRIVVASHDMKFFTPVAEYLQHAGAAVKEDLWTGHNSHDESRSSELLSWADVIISEWCLGNAVWYSQHKRDDQAMLVRLHRVEMESEYPRLLSIDRVDKVVFVSPHLLRESTKGFGWPENKLAVIANSVEVDMLDRRKLPGSEFNLGMLGYVPRRKRLDLALDILEMLRVRDSRFRLYLKGKPPWELRWVWDKEFQRSYHLEQLRRIKQSPNLRNAVSFEPFGQDIAPWFQKIGFLLSTSDSEGNQVAVAEGMAAGSIPLVLDRPGALDVYPPEYVHSTPSAATSKVWATLQVGEVERQRNRVRELARVDFSPQGIMQMWDQAICEVMPRDTPIQSSSAKSLRLDRT